MPDLSTLLATLTDLRQVVVLAAILSGVYLLYLSLSWLWVSRIRPFSRQRADSLMDDVPSGNEARPTVAPPRQMPREEPLLAPLEERATADFESELARSTTEREVQRLRVEAEQLRAEMARLSEEIHCLKAARTVSPLYEQAVTMAQQGVSAAAIADRCNISLAEAELVAALARGKTDDGACDFARRDSFVPAEADELRFDELK